MQFDSATTEEASADAAAQASIDTGAGLERVTAVLQKVVSELRYGLVYAADSSARRSLTGTSLARETEKEGAIEKQRLRCG